MFKYCNVLSCIFSVSFYISTDIHPFMHVYTTVWYAQFQRTLRFVWWRHQMETFSALLAFCAGNSPVPGEFPAQRPVTRSFDVFVDLRLNKRLSKQWWGWWFETSSCSLWRHCNGRFIDRWIIIYHYWFIHYLNRAGADTEIVQWLFY